MFTAPKQPCNVLSLPFRFVDVVLLRWPGDTERRAQLIDEGTPRLLLVEDCAEPPHLDDCLEDWIRVPAPDSDLQARMAALTSRSRSHTSAKPDLDSDGVLRLGSDWVALPPVEARLTRALLERFGAVVSRDALARAGWGEGA